MVREIALFRTREGQAEAFVEACGGVASVFMDAEGSRGASPHRGVGDPDSSTLIVESDSAGSRADLSRKPQFGSFGEAFGPYPAGRPEVCHVEAVA